MPDEDTHIRRCKGDGKLHFCADNNDLVICEECPEYVTCICPNTRTEDHNEQNYKTTTRNRLNP